MTEIKYNIVKKNNIVIIELSGEIDMSNTDKVKEIIKNNCAYEKLCMIIDLSNVLFIDSSGLGCIIAGKKYIAEKKGELKLCCLNNDIRSVFELIGLDSIIDSFSTKEEAISSFKGF